jgi:mannosyltransferase OCH1-like enzyme
MATWHGVPGFEYRLFNDATALSFIEKHFDERVSKAYRLCAVPAMKADFFRYCALKIHPGIYVDADVSRTGAVSELYLRLARGLLFTRGPRVANDFLIVKNAKDRLIEKILQTAVNNIERRSSNNIWAVTGPGIATSLLADVGPDHDLFHGYEICTVKDISVYVKFNWKLSYKETESHWVNRQKMQSIFKDDICNAE